MSAVLMPASTDLYSGPSVALYLPPRRRPELPLAPAPSGVRHIRDILPDVLARALSRAEAIHEVA